MGEKGRPPGRPVTLKKVHSMYSGATRIVITDIMSIMGLVIGEEFFLRQLLYNLLTTDFVMALWIVILLCTVAYAVNLLHVEDGIRVVHVTGVQTCALPI